MKKFGDFLKRIRVSEEKITQSNDTQETQSNNTQEIEIQIEGNINLFKNEEEQIMQGAKQLLEIGSADNMEEAIKVFAVMFRGLRFSETKKTEDGKTVVVLEEPAGLELKKTSQVRRETSNNQNEIGDR